MQLPSSRMPKQFKGMSKKRTFNVKLIPSGGVQAWDTEWDGGSKNTYFICPFYTKSVPKSYSPNKIRLCPELGEHIQPLPDFILVEESCFCGKDMPLTFHVRPEHLSVFGVTAAEALELSGLPDDVRTLPLPQLHDWLEERGDSRSKYTGRYLSTQSV